MARRVATRSAYAAPVPTDFLRNTSREGKQAWHLEKSPKKTAAAVTAHVLMAFAVLALTTAYRLHEQVEALQDEREAVTAFEEGVRQWRRRMKQENQDKVIIFVGDTYGICTWRSWRSSRGAPKEASTRVRHEG